MEFFIEMFLLALFLFGRDYLTKKFSVEPIVGGASKAEIKALEKIGCFLEEGDLLIKSEPVGFLLPYIQITQIQGLTL
jgi:hypothetical protein